ncbi:MAG: DUF6591 domain-containing protein [Bacillota bacterium]
MLKKIIVVLISTLMMLSLVSCGVSDKVNEKISEEVTEGVLDKAVGGDADVEIDGDKMTIKGKDGEFSIGGTEWPDSGAGALIPEFKKGTLVSVMNTEATCLIALEDVEKQDFERYLEELKESGFTNDPVDLNMDSTQSYTASSDDSSKITVTYDSESTGMSIALEVAQDQAGQE